MFIRLFSGDTYEEVYWPAVFDLEGMILGILIEDGSDLKDMSIEQTKEHIKACFQPFDFPNGFPLPHPSPDWIERFLDREVPFVRRLVDERREQTELSHRDPQLALNEQRLRDCTQQSSAFNLFIHNNARRTGLPR